MKTATFDIEANGFIEDVTQILCIVIKPLHGECVLYEPDEIEKAIIKLQEYDKLIAHNGIDYDANVINKLHNVDLSDRIVDTLLLSKLDDGTRHSHSLKNLGTLFNLATQKQEYSGGFDRYTPDMGSYCIDDVKTNELLYLALMENLTELPDSTLQLEHDVRILQTKAANHGVLFDERLASSTLLDIEERMMYIRNSLDLGYDEILHTYNKTKAGELTHYAKKKIKALSEAQIKHKVHDEVIKKDVYTDSDILIGIDGEGYPIYAPVKTTKETEKTVVTEYVPITPDMKKALHTMLLSKGWKPTFKTPKGSPKLVQDGEVCPNLSDMGEEYRLLAEYYMLKHRQALIKGLVDVVRRDGRIPSEADTLGAVTHRYTHRKIANFPRVSTPYGSEVRAMFTVPEGKVMVGADLAGLELRMLAHYMNDDDYTKEVLDGDIHTANQLAAGLPTRDNAKTFIYGFLYGAGDEKIGSIIGKGKTEGKSIKEKFLSSLPSLNNLIEQKKKEAKTGFVTSLDGRKIRITKAINKYTHKPVFQTHKALNSLLQSSGAIFAKTWGVYADKYLTEHKINAIIIIEYHDEMQIECSNNEKDIQGVKDALRYGVKKADEVLKTNCPNDIDIKVGNNWKETH